MERTCWTAAHRRDDNLFLGRNNQTRVPGWPMFFMSAEHAQSHITQNAQVPDDWRVARIVFHIEPESRSVP